MSFVRRIKNSRWLRGIYCIWSRNIGSLNRNGFGNIAKGVILTPPFSGNIENIYIYDNVGIGPNACLSTPNAKIIIKGNCAIAEHLTIHTGNHARIVGKFVTDITEANKPRGYDKDVIIEKDVWIGANVIILPGCEKIGDGACIGAGSIVTKNVPPYTICAGNPCTEIRKRFNEQTISLLSTKSCGRLL